MLRLKNTPQKPSKEAGYSLLEILVVLAIIAALAAVVAPRLFGNVDKAKQTATQAQVKSLRLALDTYALDTGRYPNAQEGMAVLFTPPAGDNGSWAGPYMEGTMPLDPWDNAYIYQPPLMTDNGRQTVPLVISYGADGAPGGVGLNADISSS
ncbi:type II secretion system major pseudopilin GspG [Fretibacter rubidus]|uniref:type II secretion system major pseudopilin GspG n=1 Tax=Fretibacter rubidus TaxID=570162 RepID=UPI00352ADDBA